MTETKLFEIWVSEEVTYKYRIKASNKNQAERFALDNCDEGIDVNKIEESRDRVEIINSMEVKE